MRIFQLGYPGPVGGANTECWHTVRLWRRAGWDVTLIPTWKADPIFRRKLDAIGAETVQIDGPAQLKDVPGLPGSIVVGMCNSRMVANVGVLRGLGCKIVWVPCMTFLFGHERRAWKLHGMPNAIMFQSEYQRETLGRLYRVFPDWDSARTFLIRGAFSFDEFEFEPQRHELGAEFVVGRVSRANIDKWPRNLWELYKRIPYEPKRALVMGWRGPGGPKEEDIERHCGHPPLDWAEAVIVDGLDIGEFYGRLHCYVSKNGGASENWPRVGLEAMARGVPLVVHGVGGWREMIRHGETGFLCDCDDELAYWAAYLARNEARRMEVVRAARAHLERLCAAPPLIAGWQKLFNCALNGPSPSNETADLSAGS